MTDYKSTVHLPTTDFPMKASLSQREPGQLKAWEETQLYQKIRAARAGQPKFILHDGPPYANGNIHLGHAVDKILKDFIIKSKTLNGFDAPFVPGWDCHGLPIELNVEKKFGKAGHKISAKEFRTECRKYAQSQIELQRASFKRLGVLGDWDNPYKTMDFHFEANIVRALGQIIGNNRVYKGYKPVYWCLDCASALAEAEVEYQDKTSFAIDVAFPMDMQKTSHPRLQKIAQDFDLNNIIIPIWTTTPWTLPSNEAVALNPFIEYAIVKVADRTAIIVAAKLQEAVISRYAGFPAAELLTTVQGADLLDPYFAHLIYLTHPIRNNTVVPVIGAGHVTDEDGTGFVHTAPAHGVDDYRAFEDYRAAAQAEVVSQDNNSPSYRIWLDAATGCFAKDPILEDLAGQHVRKVDVLITEKLKAKNILLNETKIQHSYPHCWRHKTPLIFLATPQWFIGMDRKTHEAYDLRQLALESIKQTQWLPEWGEARINKMVESRPDWCISRQRTWGVPIALFIDKQTGLLHPNTSQVIEKVAQLIEKEGVDAWFDLEPETLLGTDAINYQKINDTLDVWFDSGVTHYAVLSSGRWPDLQFPADLYSEGSDQYRGWFQSSLLTSVAMHNVAPYKEVITHGFTVDSKGHKMSKSLGNTIEPEKVVDSLGADILRLWVASTDYRGEMTVSDEILKRAADAYRRIRNTARYCLANLHGFDPSKDMLPAEQWLALDAWIVSEAKLLDQKVREAYDAYEFHRIYHDVHNFCVNELGSLYLDIIKDRQYTGKKDGIARRSAQSAMFHILEALVRWLAPILSFTAEEIWKYLPQRQEESVLLATWYQAFPAESALATAQRGLTNQDWDNLLALRTTVNKELENARNQSLIGAGLEAKVVIYGDINEIFNSARKLGSELRFLLITSDVLIKTEAAPSNLTPVNICHNNGSVLAQCAVEVIALPEDIKCARCWHRTDSVGKSKDHPEICNRCETNAFGNGELREFV